MLHVTKTITSVFAVGAIMLGTVAPSAFADVQIGGNGAFSSNSVWTSSNNSQTVRQTNNANFNNTVTSNNNTGNNSSNFNTGGSSSINTGSANSSVDIQNRANSNSANVGGFWGNMPFDGQKNVGIFGNGYGSRNWVNSSSSNRSSVYQNNNSYMNNYVNSRNNTGYNQSSGNTGGSFWNNNNGPFWNSNQNWQNMGWWQDGNGNWHMPMHQHMLNQFFPFNNGGGNNQISTGNASSYVNIDNAANSNSLW